jgi:hypothetical protein
MTTGKVLVEHLLACSTDDTARSASAGAYTMIARWLHCCRALWNGRDLSWLGRRTLHEVGEMVDV